MVSCASICKPISIGRRWRQVSSKVSTWILVIAIVEAKTIRTMPMNSTYWARITTSIVTLASIVPMIRTKKGIISWERCIFVFYGAEAWTILAAGMREEAMDCLVARRISCPPKDCATQNKKKDHDEQIRQQPFHYSCLKVHLEGVNRCKANLWQIMWNLKTNCNTLSVTKECSRISGEGLWTNSSWFL